MGEIDRSELVRIIREEVKRSLNVILPGQAGTDNDAFTETIDSMFPGMASQPGRPVMHPYGWSSRAPAGVISVVARHGEHFANRMILGHRDGNRPNDYKRGEGVLYNAYGQQVRMEQGVVTVVHAGGRINLGSKASAQSLVLGQIFQAMESTVLAAIAAHVHQDSQGGTTTPPDNAGVYTGQKASPVDDGKILSDHAYTEK